MSRIKKKHIAALNNSKKLQLLIGIIATLVVVVLFIEPIPQDPDYHQFAAQDAVQDIPNMWIVFSNLAFILVGAVCLVKLKGIHTDIPSSKLRTVIRIFYIGVILTGFGSAYYHYAPSNDTLLWDRLPMTISFMAFFSFILSMHISERAGTSLLWPLLAIGIASVLFWVYSEGLGRGDLRFYAVVQFLPVILIPLILLMFPNPAYKQSYIWLVIAVYIAAKLTEQFDHQIYDLCGIGGHIFKHLIAALAGIAFFLAVKSISRDH